MSLPKTPIKGDPETRRFLESVRQTLSDIAGKTVTIADMRKSGFFENNGIDVPVNPTIPGVALPNAPSNLAADGAFENIVLTWDYVDYAGHSHSRIYRNTTNNFTTAEVLANVDGRVYSDAVGSDQSFYYWVSNVNVNEAESATSQTAGVLGQTAPNVGYLLETLTNSITESQLYTTLGARIDLIDAEGTGLVDRVDDLQETYGTTVSAAASAAEAAQSASDAITAKAQAIVAQGSAESAAVSANSSKLSAQSANSSAQTAASSAITSSQTAANYATNAEAAATASQNSSLSASASAGTATTKANIATTAAANAQTSADGAAQSASAAQTSKIAAETASSAASVARTEAVAAKDTATTKASEASQSATTAATSALNASNSASAAAGSATTASTKATEAGTSATAASTAKVAAEAARDNAATSATAAATSASTASAKATEAGQSATSASTSANTASTAAADALVYKNSAATSATTAEGYATAAAQDYTAVNVRLNNAGGTGVTVEQAFTANADSISGLSGQYTVKIDTNGYVSGFGLASTLNNATPFSSFIVRANSFSIASPSGPGIAPVVPFIVRTTETTVNGVTVPVGVYMDGAYIQNGSITNAKIGNAVIDDAKIANLSAAKITTGSLDAGRISIDGVTLDTYFDSSVDRNRLYIRDLGVGSAKIQDAAITSAKIGNAEVGTLKIAGNAVTQPIVYTSADIYVTSGLTESGGTTCNYVFVGAGNGDYNYNSSTFQFQYVGLNNGSYDYICTTSPSTITGGHTAIETGFITVGDSASGGLIIVFYGTIDASATKDAGQYFVMQIDGGSGWTTVLRTLSGMRTAGGDTYYVMPVALPYSATNLQSVRVRVVTSNRAISTGAVGNNSYLRNITLSLLGAKR